MGISNLMPPRPNPQKREQINLNFIFRFPCGALKGFMKALKVKIA